MPPQTDVICNSGSRAGCSIYRCIEANKSQEAVSQTHYAHTQQCDEGHMRQTFILRCAT